jgi:OFA family oxalate/formate antiporter-like MFS transporter
MNRYINIMVPGIFLPLSLGTVYNFSQYSANIAQLFEITKFQTDIGFTLIIFFLGMSAAVFGRFIEMFPKRMSIVSTILFAAGMLTMFISTSFLPAK